MTPARKPLFQRLKSALAGVCARLLGKRRPAKQPAPPAPPLPQADPQALLEAAFAEQVYLLQSLFEAWLAGRTAPETPAHPDSESAPAPTGGLIINIVLPKPQRPPKPHHPHPAHARHTTGPPQKRPDIPSPTHVHIITLS